MVLTETSHDQPAERATDHDPAALSADASTDSALAHLDALAQTTARTKTRVLIDEPSRVSCTPQFV